MKRGKAVTSSPSAERVRLSAVFAESLGEIPGQRPDAARLGGASSTERLPR